MPDDRENEIIVLFRQQPDGLQKHAASPTLARQPLTPGQFDCRS